MKKSCISVRKWNAKVVKEPKTIVPVWIDSELLNVNELAHLIVPKNTTITVCGPKGITTELCRTTLFPFVQSEEGVYILSLSHHAYLTTVIAIEVVNPLKTSI